MDKVAQSFVWAYCHIIHDSVKKYLTGDIDMKSYRDALSSYWDDIIPESMREQNVTYVLLKFLAQTDGIAQTPDLDERIKELSCLETALRLYKATDGAQEKVATTLEKLLSKVAERTIIEFSHNKQKSRILYNQYKSSMSKYQQQCCELVLKNLLKPDKVLQSPLEHSNIIKEYIQEFLELSPPTMLEKVALTCQERWDKDENRFLKMIDDTDDDISDTTSSSNSDDKNGKTEIRVTEMSPPQSAKSPNMVNLDVIAESLNKGIDRKHTQEPSDGPPKKVSRPTLDIGSVSPENHAIDRNKDQENMPPPTHYVPKFKLRHDVKFSSLHKKFEIPKKPQSVQGRDFSRKVPINASVKSFNTGFSSRQKHQFTPLQDAYIIFGMQKYGSDKQLWCKIIKHYPFPEYRKPGHLKDRWRTLLKNRSVKLQNGEIIASPRYKSLLAHLYSKYEKHGTWEWNISSKDKKSKRNKIIDDDELARIDDSNYFSPDDLSGTEEYPKPGASRSENITEWINTGKFTAQEVQTPKIPPLFPHEVPKNRKVEDCAPNEHAKKSPSTDNENCAIQSNHSGLDKEDEIQIISDDENDLLKEGAVRSKTIKSRSTEYVANINGKFLPKSRSGAKARLQSVDEGVVIPTGNTDVLSSAHSDGEHSEINITVHQNKDKVSDVEKERQTVEAHTVEMLGEFADSIKTRSNDKPATDVGTSITPSVSGDRHSENSRDDNKPTNKKHKGLSGEENAKSHGDGFRTINGKLTNKEGNSELNGQDKHLNRDKRQNSIVSSSPLTLTTSSHEFAEKSACIQIRRDQDESANYDLSPHSRDADDSKAIHVVGGVRSGTSNPHPDGTLAITEGTPTKIGRNVPSEPNVTSNSKSNARILDTPVLSPASSDSYIPQSPASSVYVTGDEMLSQSRSTISESGEEISVVEKTIQNCDTQNNVKQSFQEESAHLSESQPDTLDLLARLTDEKSETDSQKVPVGDHAQGEDADITLVENIPKEIDRSNIDSAPASSKEDAGSNRTTQSSAALASSKGRDVVAPPASTTVDEPVGSADCPDSAGSNFLQNDVTNTESSFKNMKGNNSSVEDNVNQDISISTERLQPSVEGGEFNQGSISDGNTKRGYELRNHKTKRPISKRKQALVKEATSKAKAVKKNVESNSASGVVTRRRLRVDSSNSINPKNDSGGSALMVRPRLNFKKLKRRLGQVEENSSQIVSANEPALLVSTKVPITQTLTNTSSGQQTSDEAVNQRNITSIGTNENIEIDPTRESNLPSANSICSTLDDSSVNGTTGKRTPKRLPLRKKKHSNLLSNRGAPLKISKEDDAFLNPNITAATDHTSFTTRKSRQGSRKKWSTQEDRNLFEGVKLYGEGNWKKTLDHFCFNNRTTVHLKDRYRVLKNK